MTVKHSWADRRGGSLRAIERPDVRLPNLEIRRIDLPHVDLRNVDLPRVDLRNVDLRNIDLPSVDLSRADLPHVDLPHVDLHEVDFGGVGRAVSEQISAIAESLSEALADTGDRAREAVTIMAANLPADLPLVSRFRPQPRSSTRLRILAFVGASAVAATVAGLYVLFAPGSGARRRAALRSRLQGTPAAAQRGIGAAVGSAKQVGDRAVELVRVPIETARERVGNHTGDSRQAEGEQPDETSAELHAINAIDVAALERDADAPADLAAVAIEAEAAEDGFTDAGVAQNIYGDSTAVGDETAELAEAGLGAESQKG